jgi:hypothetical protein
MQNSPQIGKHVGFDSAELASTFEVVGVARDAKYNDPSELAQLRSVCARKLHRRHWDLRRNCQHYPGTPGASTEPMKALRIE